MSQRSGEGRLNSRLANDHSESRLGASQAEELFDQLSNPTQSEIEFHNARAKRGGSVGADEHGNLVRRTKSGRLVPIDQLDDD